MNGYLNLLILGYFHWLILDILTIYMSPITATILTLLIVAWFIFQALKEIDYIGLTFVTWFIAYALNKIHHTLVLSIYSEQILLIVCILKSMNTCSHSVNADSGPA